MRSTINSGERADARTRNQNKDCEMVISTAIALLDLLLLLVASLMFLAMPYIVRNDMCRLTLLVNVAMVTTVYIAMLVMI